MFKQLRQNSPINYLIIFALMLIMWMYKSIYMPTAINAYEIKSYFFRFSFESGTLQYISTFAAFFIYFIFGLYLSKYNLKLQIVSYGYQIPALIFLLLTGTLINAQRCIPELFASVFMFASVIKIFETYNQQEAKGKCLDAGLLYGISILFMYKFVLIFPAILIVLFIVKPVTWRDLMSLVFGILIVISLAFCFTWLYGDINQLISTIKTETFKKILGEKYIFTNFLFQTPIVFSIMVATLSLLMVRVTRKISETKYYISMIFLMVYFTILLISPILSNEAISLMYFPLCFLLTNVIVNAKHIYGNIVVWGLILSLLFSQTIQIIYYHSIF